MSPVAPSVAPNSEREPVVTDGRHGQPLVRIEDLSKTFPGSARSTAWR